MWDNPTNAPSAESYKQPLVDFSGLAKLPDDYFAGTQMRQKLQEQQVFKGGLPTDASGNPDYMAAANKLYSIGDMAGANSMMQTAIARQGMTQANEFNKFLLGDSATPTASASSPVAASPPAARSSSATSLGASINNPGDIRDKLPDGSTNPWVAKLPGYRGSKNGFAVFDTPENGIAATDANLASYNKQGVNTPLAIANKWAPKGDGDNNPQVYGQRIASALGIGLNDPIDLTNPAVRGKLRDAMFAQEGTNQGAFAPGGQQQAAAAPGTPAPSGTSPAGGPWAKDAEGNPVQTNADGVAVQGQTPAMLHQANAQQAQKAASPPGAPVQQPPVLEGQPEPGAPPDAQALSAAPPQPQSPIPQPQPQPQEARPAGAPGPGAGQPLDPNLSGLVPKRWTDRGGTAGSYVTMLRTMAATPGMPPNAVTSWNKTADGIEQTIARSAAARAGSVAEYEIGHLSGETPDAYRARTAGEVAEAEGKAKSKYETVETQSEPGGPVRMVPKSSVLNPGPGGENSTITKQPAAFAKGQEELVSNDNQQVQQYQIRQVARQRLQSISKLLQGYQPGAFAEEKADLATHFAALGFPVPPEAMANAAAFQEFTKNTIANVFSDVKSMGGRPLVSEIAGLSKGAANPSLQPQANQAILGQGMGLLDYYDKHAGDYFDWRKKNQNAYNSADFEIPWIKGNPPGKFVDSATKNIAVKGIAIPADPGKRVVGQLYVGPKGNVGRWMGNGWQPEGGQ